MLRSLSIQNFALIEKAQINFSNGFTAITGETGSGKSILLGALNLILGNRADYSVIRNSEQKTIVEAVFQLSDENKSWFQDNDIDFDKETIIRREIASNGKSRAFVNDSLVQLNQLTELTEQLIYIHSQHETLSIRKTAFQFELIDSYGGFLEESKFLEKKIQQLFRLKSNYKNLIVNQSNNTRELEFAQFLLDEIDSLELEKYNFQEIEDEFSRFDKIDEIKSVYSLLIQAIEAENGILDSLRIVKSTVDKWKSADTKINEIALRLESSLYELQDVGSEAQNNFESLEINPERLDFLSQKLDKFNTCLKKNACSTQEELIVKKNELIAQIEKLDTSEEKLNALQKEIELLEIECDLLASKLFEKRTQSSIQLKNHLESLLKELKLPSARLDFDIKRLVDLDLNGGMNIQLLFSANEGMELKSIDKAASGGELSRLMLAIQATMSEKKSLPTLILDEIDTGVSGEVALRIGQLLHQMGTKIQVFAITHLPQVAAKGQFQFEVKKSVQNSVTKTEIVELNLTDRVTAIAKLMSGETVTPIAQQNAQQLLEL